ncbi:MAG: DUF4139 domain-containing protein, partial [Candidatus Zixiibacteriota bacterium]
MKLYILVLSLLILPISLIADEIAVTVYNSNLGVISETRSLEFSKGINQLAFKDVPSLIDAASVQFEIIDIKHNVSILEQNYAYDLVNPEQMYAKYIDKEIELIDKEGEYYSGTLLAYSRGAITLQEKSGRIKIILMDNITEVNFPALPEGLITKPTLFWLYNSDFSGQLNSRIGYQTSGMNWSAEYVGILNPDETQLGLSGWASINNTSGKSYNNAKLKLIAGDIHRVTPSRRGVMKTMSLAEDMSGAGFEEKAFFEYHLYTLPRKATLGNKEIKQISLFEPSNTKVNKVFIYRPERNPKKVEVAIKLKNSKTAGLGLPLPAGRVRLFKADDDGALILLGEDQIDHTPKNEEVKLKVGFAFDIVAKEELMSQKRVSSKVEEQEIKIELSNRKEEAITVEVEKKLYGFWEIIESNLDYQKKDAYTLIFKVPVAAD